jgi:hypothetical protein
LGYKTLQSYAPQTKIWEGGTKDEMWIFEALFKGVSTQFGPRTIEKGFENPHFIFCSSFPNLRLGGIKVPRKVRSIRVRSTFQILRLGGVRFMFCSSCPVLLKGACATTRRRVVCRSHCMCLSNLQDDSMMIAWRCVSRAHKMMICH